jgi:hypothetical protein
MVKIGNVSDAEGMRYKVSKSRSGWQSRLPGSVLLTGSSVRSVPAKYRFTECLRSNIESWVHLVVEVKGHCFDGQKLHVKMCSTGVP